MTDPRVLKTAAKLYRFWYEACGIPNPPPFDKAAPKTFFVSLARIAAQTLGVPRFLRARRPRKYAQPIRRGSKAKYRACRIDRGKGICR